MEDVVLTGGHSRATPREYEPAMMGHSLEDQMGTGHLSAGSQHCCWLKWHLLWLGGHIKVDTGALKLWWANWKASGHQVPRQHPWGSSEVGRLDQCGREDSGASGSSYLSIGMGAFLNLTTWFLGLPSKIGGVVGFPISVRRYQLKQWAKKLINRRARGS